MGCLQHWPGVCQRQRLSLGDGRPSSACPYLRQTPTSLRHPFPLKQIAPPPPERQAELAAQRQGIITDIKIAMGGAMSAELEACMLQGEQGRGGAGRAGAGRDEGIG